MERICSVIRASEVTGSRGWNEAGCVRPAEDSPGWLAALTNVCVHVIHHMSVEALAAEALRWSVSAYGG
jgi:hypothetical protein